MRSSGASAQSEAVREAAAVEAEPTGIIDALLRVLESGQRIVLDRFDLARFDLTQLAAHTLRGIVLIAIGMVLLAGAWFALMGGVLIWLRSGLALSLPVSLGIIAGFNAVLGAAAIGVGVQRARPPDTLDVGAALRRTARGEDEGANGHDRP